MVITIQKHLNSRAHEDIARCLREGNYHQAELYLRMLQRHNEEFEVWLGFALEAYPNHRDELMDTMTEQLRDEPSRERLREVVKEHVEQYMSGPISEVRRALDLLEYVELDWQGLVEDMYL